MNTLVPRMDEAPSLHRGRSNLPTLHATLVPLLESVPVALAITLGPDRLYAFANQSFRDLLRSRSDIVGRTMLEARGRLCTPETLALHDRVLVTGEVQVWRGAGEKHSQNLALTLLPLRDESERVIGVMTIGPLAAALGEQSAHSSIEKGAIFDRESLSGERQLLLRELNHRIKNLFAVTSSIIALTARSALTPQEMADSLRGRLDALAQAHDLIQPVVAGRTIVDQSTTLRDLSQTVLAPYRRDDGTSPITIVGPRIEVGAKAATTLTLVLHELATNAVKYGALSQSEGLVSLAWDEEESRIVLRWSERGGPAISAPPTREGFGSQLTRRSIARQLNGTVAHAWHPEGLTVTLMLPVDRLQR